MTLATSNQANLMEQVLIEGDLSALTPAQRLEYYQKVCESLGLNPVTKPFAYLRLNNKLVLYALRDATEQLRKLHNISTHIVAREWLNDLYIVTARASRPDGRADESIGAVPVANLKGESLANAIMKAETKAKRRVTLSINGLGFLDETEVDSIPQAKVVPIDPHTGELPQPPQNRPTMPVETLIPDKPTQPPQADLPRYILDQAREWNNGHKTDGPIIMTDTLLEALDLLYGYKVGNLSDGLQLLAEDQALELASMIANGDLFAMMKLAIQHQAELDKAATEMEEDRLTL